MRQGRIASVQGAEQHRPPPPAKTTPLNATRAAGEPVLPPAGQQEGQQQQGQGQQQQPAFDVEATTTLMAQQLVAQFKATEALILALPQERLPAAAHSERIRRLQAENEAAASELEAAAAEAEEQLAELQRMFAALAQQRLRDAQRGLALPPLPPMG
jgi:hypothetical protein